MNTAKSSSPDGSRGNESPAEVLVSVRNAEEARLLLASDVTEIVDLKEPLLGSLGCPGFSVAKEFSEQIEIFRNSRLAQLDAGALVTSIALGEVWECPVWPGASADEAREVLKRFDFAKFGLSKKGNCEHGNWVDRWKAAFDQVPENVSRVAVAYADWERADSPPPTEVVKSAAEVTASVLLVDTFDKGTGLVDLMSTSEIASLVEVGREAGLKVALAGSLTIEQAISLRMTCDIVAVRGAICGQDRKSAIDPERLLEFRTAMSQSGPDSSA